MLDKIRRLLEALGKIIDDLLFPDVGQDDDPPWYL